MGLSTFFQFCPLIAKECSESKDLALAHDRRSVLLYLGLKCTYVHLLKLVYNCILCICLWTEWTTWLAFHMLQLLMITNPCVLLKILAHPRFAGRPGLGPEVTLGSVYREAFTATRQSPQEAILAGAEAGFGNDVKLHQASRCLKVVR